jgi:hypothetical protein
MADTRQKTDSVIPAEVRELIEESQKIHGWIDKLDAHASDARPEVFEKVRADYRKRLDGVNGQLTEHRVQLVDTLESRRSEVEALREDRDGHAAELEEVRLRHAVGEFDDGAFEKRSGKIQSSLDDLDQLLADEDRTVSELAEIIAMISSAGTAGAVADAASGGKAAEAVGIAAPEADESGEADTASGGSPEEAVDREPAAESADAAGDDAPAPATAEGDDEKTSEVAAEKAGAAGGDTGAAQEETPTGPSPAAPGKSKMPPEKVTLDAEDDAEGGDYLDELEFLESLSLSEADRFDAVSAMLDEDEGKTGSD